jgi:serine protease AprX
MRGLCPDIKLIDVRVCRDDGTSDEFVIMSALQFLRYLNANTDFIAVHGVNMSVSLVHDAANYACGQTPICDEAERTVSSGVVVVAAAGNLGYRRLLAEGMQPYEQFCPVSITDPGNADSVITVGATHRLEPHSYGVSYFSSRGPTGDGRIKPDLVAPGEKIFAPTLENSAVRLDGTSMAAPHVSGAAAMLMARNVELAGRPRKIKEILCSTATDLGRERYFQGHGLLDVLRAMQSV